MYKLFHNHIFETYTSSWKKNFKTILFKTILVYSDVFKNVCVLWLPIKEYSLKKYLMQELLAITDFQNIHVLDLHALI